jgi:hypothetical protein
MMGHARLLLLAMVQPLAIAVVLRDGVDLRQRMYFPPHTISVFHMSLLSSLVSREKISRAIASVLGLLLR